MQSDDLIGHRHARLHFYATSTGKTFEIKVRAFRVSDENCEVIFRALVEREEQKRGTEIICDVGYLDREIWECLIAVIIP